MVSSGTTAQGTSGAGNKNLLVIPSGTYGDSARAYYLTLVIINEGAVAGFFSIDGGTTWGRIPAGPGAVCPPFPVQAGTTVLIKRDGNVDMTGVYAYAG